uniref:Uncharacterized protein n=1 Tax=Rhizophora mucronata TaxID=61149 RepID=A0A2P2NA68_RHIMU
MRLSFAELLNSVSIRDVIYSL